MIIFVVILVLVAIVVTLSTRLHFINKDLHTFKCELERFDGDNFKKNLTITSGSKGVEELATVINKKIEEFTESVIHYRNMEDGLKQSISNMSHDLRTPLTSVVGYLQLLEKETDIDQGRQYLEIAERRAKTLQVMIDGFFELSMIESPQYPLSIEVVDLKSALAKHLAGFYDDFESKGIQAKVDLPEKPIKIFADIHALDRIIINLLGNVVLHAQGNVLVHVSDDQSTVTLEISNSATGLLEEEIDKIFDRFYTADKVRNGKSSGLGLPIVKTLVEKLGGTITASFVDNILTMRLVFRKLE